MTEPRHYADITPEDRRELAQMMRSRPFRILLERVIVPKLEQLSLQLDNHSIPHDMTQFLRGQKYNARQFLDYCTTLAGIPSLFTPRQATGVDVERILQALTEEQPIPSVPKAAEEYTPSYGSGRAAFPA